MGSESMFIESDPFISVLEQENEARRLEHLSTSPQRGVNETGRISPQDELRSQFAEARQIRDARQDIIREIQEYSIDIRRITLGSDRRNTIPLLKNAAVSPFHSKLTVERDLVYLTD